METFSRWPVSILLEWTVARGCDHLAQQLAQKLTALQSPCLPRQRRRPRRRFALAGADVRRPALFVLRRGKLLQFARFAALHGLLEKLFQEGNAPAAAGAGAAALRKLARDLRLGPPQVVHQLAARHVEAETHL